MRYLSFWTLLLLTSPLVFAQTSLNTGDLAFTVKNLDDSGVPSFGFMTMVNLSSGTVIKFTDHGWDGSTFFNISEGELTLTLSTSVDAGGQILVNKENGKAFLMNGTTQVGTVV